MLSSDSDQVAVFGLALPCWFIADFLSFEAKLCAKTEELRRLKAQINFGWNHSECWYRLKDHFALFKSVFSASDCWGHMDYKQYCQIKQFHCYVRPQGTNATRNRIDAPLFPHSQGRLLPQSCSPMKDHLFTMMVAWSFRVSMAQKQQTKQSDTKLTYLTEKQRKSNTGF